MSGEEAEHSAAAGHGGEHVGQQGTAAQRQGHHVAAVARNEARRRRDDARERARAARERMAALEQLKRAIEDEAARVPSLPPPPDIVAPDATPLPKDVRTQMVPGVNSSGAVYCWQCARPLLRHVAGDSISS